MSVKYQNTDELRYIKYQNLLEESRIVANYYRDQIHAFGMDCTYYKSSVNLPPEFNNVLSSNNLMRQAYGYDPDIKFELTANLITYTEVENDIFVLDRLGHHNDQKTYFYFDLTEFATAFMAKLGQFKEYPFDSQIISGKVENGQIEFETDFNTSILSGKVYCHDFVDIDAKYASTEHNEYIKELDGGPNGAKPSNVWKPIYDGGDADMSLPRDKIAHCRVLSHSSPMFSMPVNEFIARSFNYEAHDGDLAFISYFKYTLYPNGTYIGKLDGTVLYYDLDLVSKYAQKIRPDVGDIISLHTSFGDIVYEVNDIQSQDMATDGINPLIFKYIWKISAQRRINSYEDTAPEEDGNTWNKKELAKENLSRIYLNNTIEPFEDDQDLVYGGFKGTNAIGSEESWVSSDISWDTSELYIGSYMNIITFGNGSELMTDGLNLYFKNTHDAVTKLSLYSGDYDSSELSGIPVSLRYIKADSSNIYFQDVDGKVQKLVGTATTKDKVILELNKRFEEDYQKVENEDGMNFFKFPNCRTILFSSPDNLYAKLEDIDEFYRLA